MLNTNVKLFRFNLFNRTHIPYIGTKKSPAHCGTLLLSDVFLRNQLQLQLHNH